MRPFLTALSVVALLAGPAFAQGKPDKGDKEAQREARKVCQQGWPAFHKDPANKNVRHKEYITKCVANSKPLPPPPVPAPTPPPTPAPTPAPAVK